MIYVALQLSYKKLRVDMKSVMLFVFGLVASVAYSQTEVLRHEGETSSVEMSLTPGTKSAELLLSPNPVSDMVTIQAEGVTDGKIRIVDVLGNTVYTGDFNNAKKLNLSDYKNGVYFVTIQSVSDKGLTKKLVVRH